MNSRVRQTQGRGDASRGNGLLLSPTLRYGSKVPMNEVLTVAEVAAFLRVNRSTVYKLIRRGELPAFKVGSDWRFNRTQIEELFKFRTPDPEER
jgi:excisionase family DNA binding protein